MYTALRSSFQVSLVLQPTPFLQSAKRSWSGLNCGWIAIEIIVKSIVAAGHYYFNVSSLINFQRNVAYLVGRVSLYINQTYRDSSAIVMFLTQVGHCGGPWLRHWQLSWHGKAELSAGVNSFSGSWSVARWIREHFASTAQRSNWLVGASLYTALLI